MRAKLVIVVAELLLQAPGVTAHPVHPRDEGPTLTVDMLDLINPLQLSGTAHWHLLDTIKVIIVTKFEQFLWLFLFFNRDQFVAMLFKTTSFLLSARGNISSVRSDCGGNMLWQSCLCFPLLWFRPRPESFP